jgi:hypothetical protein
LFYFRRGAFYLSPATPARRRKIYGPKNAQFYKAEDEKMAAGLNIYKAMTDATQTATFVFDWDDNFTIGFYLV